jgi:glutamate carboxypeptidase
MLKDILAHHGLDPIGFLKDVVAIDSVTANHAGVERVQKRLAARLARMNFDIQWRANPLGPAVSSELLIATLPPDPPYAAGQDYSYITLVTHADTVLGPEHVGPYTLLTDADADVDVDESCARGAGIIDNKGGSVVALTGLELFLIEQARRGPRRFGIRFVSSPNEEAGSIGFNEGFRDYAKDSAIALGFEPALDDGSIIRSRRGNRWYHIKIKGIEAHAGRSRGEHVNAAHELAIKISRLHKLNDPKKEIAVNVGHIRGGRDKFNVVCGFAEAKLDTRFASFEGRDRLHSKIERILYRHTVSSHDGSAEPDVEVEIADDCPPFSSTSRSRRFVGEYTRLISAIEGREIRAASAGGAGDVNYMSDPSVIVIDGLGPVGGRMHTENEFIRLSTLTTRSLALARFLELIEDRF